MKPKEIGDSLWSRRSTHLSWLLWLLSLRRSLLLTVGGSASILLLAVAISESRTGASDERAFLIPVEGVEPEDLTPSFDDPREGRRKHQAIDISAPRGTKVVAAANGRIASLTTTKRGGTSIYLVLDGGQLSLYYAHLRRYARGLEEGMRVEAGKVLGRVGTTGNAPRGAPHLHFAIYRLRSAERYWEGEPIDPYPWLRRGELPTVEPDS